MGTFTFSDIFKSDFYSIFSVDVSAEKVLITLGLSLALGFLIFGVYKLSFKGILYSKNFNIALILLTMITSSIILAISTNVVLSLGMVGALSIVRFRAAIKDPIDIVYIFWAISVGIITGAGMYVLAIFVTVIIGIIALVFSKLSFSDCSFLFVVGLDNAEPREAVISEIKKSVRKYGLKSAQSTKDKFELILELRASKDLTDMVESVRKLEGVNEASLLSYNGDYVV